jgi:hypothetical protein
MMNRRKVEDEKRKARLNGMEVAFIHSAPFILRSSEGGVTSWL